MLPTSSTTTLLDHYVTVSIVLMTLLVLQNSSLMMFDDEDAAITYDKWCLRVIITLWCLYHGYIYAFMDNWRLSWQQTAGEDDFEVKTQPFWFCLSSGAHKVSVIHSNPKDFIPDMGGVMSIFFHNFRQIYFSLC